jgi:ElaB/YqjD/DUF883 family membrane-anchored ribosome-binding protein
MSDAKGKIKEGNDDAAAKVEHATEQAGDKSKGVADEKKSETDDATARAKVAIQEGVELAKKAADAVTEKTSDLTTGAGEHAGKAVAKFQQGSEQATQLARQGFRHFDTMVRANPGPSLALAFGLGIGIGFILGSALRPRRELWSFMR